MCNCYFIENSYSCLIMTIIKAETCCTLYNKYFANYSFNWRFSYSLINFADHNLLFHPQITNQYLIVWFLIYWVSRFKYLCQLALYSHILRGSCQSLQTNSAIANQIISRPNLSDPSHSLFTNHSVTRSCTAGTADKRH